MQVLSCDIIMFGSYTYHICFKVPCSKINPLGEKLSWLQPLMKYFLLIKGPMVCMSCILQEVSSILQVMSSILQEVSSILQGV